MFKTGFTFIIAVLIAGTAYAQRAVERPIKAKTVSTSKTLDLTIKLDSSINPKKVWYQYYDGKNTIMLPDTLVGKRKVKIKRKYFSEMVSVIVTCFDAAGVEYRFEFLVGDRPASFIVKLIPNEDHLLSYTDLKNAIPTEDSVVNKSWAHRVAFMKRYSDPKENVEFDLFLKQNSEFYKNDSLKLVFDGFMKHFRQLDLNWIRTYPNDYFSFWYFNNHIAGISGFNNDKTELQKQLDFYTKVFPDKFINSVEGKWMIKKFKDRINGIELKPKDVAPAFTIKTTDGKKVSLNKFKGKYVLLDFWATWCAPCMAEMPFIKDVRKKYGPEKLAIIGVSADTDSKKLITVAKQQHMAWPQYYDEDMRIRDLYQVTSIPALFLIDREGKLVYKSDFQHPDADRLPKALEAIN